MLRDPAFRSQPAHVRRRSPRSSCRRRSPCPSALALLVNRARVVQAFFRSVFFLPTACSYVVASLVWKMSIFSGRPVRAWPTRCSAGSASTRSPWLSADPAAVVLAGHRHRAAVAAGRLLHDPVPRRPAADLARRSTRRPRSTAPTGWKVLPPHHPAAAARRRRWRCCCCCSSTRSRRSTSSTTCSRRSGSYPPYARPPLVYLYYTALGSGQDFGHGSAGAVILTLRHRRGRAWPGPPPAARRQERLMADPSRSRASPAPWAAAPLRRPGASRAAAVPRPLLPAAAQRPVSRGGHHLAGLDAGSRRAAVGATSPSCSTTRRADGAQPAQLGRSSRSPRRSACSSSPGWPATGWPASRTAASNAVFYAILATLLIPAAVTFVPSFVLVSTLGWVSHPARPDRPGAVPGVRDVPLPAVLPRASPGARGGGPHRRPRLLGHVLARSWCRTRRASSRPSARSPSSALERVPLAAGHRPGPGVVDGADRAVDLPHRADRATCTSCSSPRAIAILPLLVMFLFLQRWIVEGVERTGIAGD